MSEESQSGSMPAPPSSGRKPKVAEAPAPAAEVKAEEKKVEQPSPKQEEPVVKKAPFMVVALRAGFYERVRRAQGDKFMVDDEKKLGSWMKKV